jgi:hypothetical protein
VQKAIICLQHNELIFVMVKRYVFFEIQTEFLNIIYMSFGFKGLRIAAPTPRATLVISNTHHACGIIIHTNHHNDYPCTRPIHS